MRGFVPPDPYTKVSEEQFAVVYVPKRSRNRFPKGCVDVVSSKEEALKKSNPDQKQFPARVLGPSKSSEGQIIYYLVEWLDV